MVFTAWFMLKDTLYWFVLICFVVLAFSVSLTPILYQHPTDVFWAFWSLFGELDGIEDRAKSLVWPLSTFARFMTYFLCVLANVLLMNLLIAIMNNTYEKVQSDSKTEWAYLRVTAIFEYDQVSALPPPLNLLTLPYYCFQWCRVKSEQAVFSARRKSFSGHVGDLDSGSEEEESWLFQEQPIFTQRDLQE